MYCDASHRASSVREPVPVDRRYADRRSPHPEGCRSSALPPDSTFCSFAGAWSPLAEGTGACGRFRACCSGSASCYGLRL